jgi:hypothetical protein
MSFPESCSTGNVMAILARAVARAASAAACFTGRQPDFRSCVRQRA